MQDDYKFIVLSKRKEKMAEESIFIVPAKIENWLDDIELNQVCYQVSKKIFFIAKKQFRAFRNDINILFAKQFQEFEMDIILSTECSYGATRPFVEKFVKKSMNIAYTGMVK